MKLGEMMYLFMINHRQENSKNIISHRLHSGIFKWHGRGSYFVTLSITYDFSDTLASHFDKNQDK